MKLLEVVTRRIAKKVVFYSRFRPAGVANGWLPRCMTAGINDTLLGQHFELHKNMHKICVIVV